MTPWTDESAPVDQFPRDHLPRMIPRSPEHRSAWPWVFIALVLFWCAVAWIATTAQCVNCGG